MSPQDRDERTKVGNDGRAVVSSRRGSAVTAVLLFLALVLVVDGVAGERGWVANRRGQQRLDQAQTELDQVRRENQDLRDLAKRLKDRDPATIEELARRGRGFIRPGEKLFIIRDVPKAQ